VAYDVNKRWLSEVLDFGSASQPVKVFADTGLSGGHVSVALPAFGAATTVRVAFQVKTNRQYADETYDLQGYDSAEGAALIDDVKLNSVLLTNGDFEAANAIRPRNSLPGGGAANDNSPSTFWITTGKPRTTTTRITPSSASPGCRVSHRRSISTLAARSRRL
jgi:hypothetical protein